LGKVENVVFVSVKKIFSLRKREVLNTLLRVTCNEGILALAVVYAVVQLKDYCFLFTSTMGHVA